MEVSGVGGEGGFGEGVLRGRRSRRGVLRAGEGVEGGFMGEGVS